MAGMAGPLTFEQFLSDSAAQGKAVNLAFEERLFRLAGILHKITGPLMAAGLPHELIGGLAVLVHVDAAGLVTVAVEEALEPELRARLQHVRETE